MHCTKRGARTVLSHECVEGELAYLTNSIAFSLPRKYRHSMDDFHWMQSIKPAGLLWFLFVTSDCHGQSKKKRQSARFESKSSRSPGHNGVPQYIANLTGPTKRSFSDTKANRTCNDHGKAHSWSSKRFLWITLNRVAKTFLQDPSVTSPLTAPATDLKKDMHCRSLRNTSVRYFLCPSLGKNALRPKLSSAGRTNLGNGSPSSKIKRSRFTSRSCAMCRDRMLQRLSTSAQIAATSSASSLKSFVKVRDCS